MTSWVVALASRGLLDVDEDEDPRVGSGRDGSGDKGTLSTSSNSKSSSLKSLGATFIPVVVYCVVCILIFIVLRPRCHRVYAPRTLQGLRSPQRPSPALPSGWFNWIKPFFQIPDTFVLNHGSLDSFFFLRFLKILRNIFVVGICIVWPVLMPLHITGGNKLTQLDILTIGNVSEPKKMFAHAFVAWAFFGFVLYTIARECIYYINLRQAYLSSPHHAKRLSSRTVMLTCVPQQYLDEARLRKLYGDSVKRIWIPRTAKVLANLVKERDQTAMRLEKAEIDLIRKANAARKKKMRTKPPASPSSEACASPSQDSVNTATDSDTRTADSRFQGISATERDVKNIAGQTEETPTSPQNSEKTDQDLEYMHPYGLDPDLPDVRGSVAAQWIPVQSRPYHRPIGNFGRRVDTIRWTRVRLKELNIQIFKLRRQLQRGDGAALPAAFIEFDTQEAAQAAHQVLAHHRPLQLSPRILGVRPDEVIWSSLRMRWWERIVRRFLITGLVTAAIIFWSIPSAFIGVVSNIGFLSKFIFLRWINKLPGVITGFLQGFVPAMALSLWMSLVPGMLRICAVQAGIPSTVLVELFTQNAYFAFQVVQVFLVTTLTSAASAAFRAIIKDPFSTMDVLAKHLPKASNFYLSYILIQCLAIGGNGIVNLFELFRQYGFGRVAQMPRTRFNIWYNLRLPRWGGVYPVYTNMAVIAVSYSCIAPLILVFAAGGMAFMRIVYRYNIIFVFDSEMDSKGLFYPRALLQLIVGLYMAEICLIGLFVLNFAFGPMVLMIVFLIFTGLMHYSLTEAIEPLLHNLPQTLSLEEEVQEQERLAHQQSQDAAQAGPDSGGGAANDYYDTEQAFGDQQEEEDLDEDEDVAHDPVPSTRAVEGASGITSALTEWLKSSAKEKVTSEAEKSGLTRLLDRINVFGSGSQPGEPPSLVRRFLHPEIYEDFVALRNMIALENNTVEESGGSANALANYWPPELWLPKPTLWIPRDEARVSRQEVAHSKKVVPISDRGVTLDEKGRMTIDFGQAPFNRQRWLY